MDAQLFIEQGTWLNEGQRQMIRDFVGFCNERDGLSLSYPLEQEDGPVSHYWMTDGSGQILSVLSVSYWEDNLAECTAFTHPDFRGRGYFSRLLETALETYGEDDLLFPVFETCADTMAALKALDAEMQFQEYVMKYDLTINRPMVSSYQRPIAALKAPDNMFSENACWTLFQPAISGGSLIGSCRTSPASEGCLCLHHVEICPDMRGQGLGFSLICQLLNCLHQAKVRQLILQVSGQNQAALALYKKAGFQIAETLSYYLL